MAFRKINGRFPPCPSGLTTCTEWGRWRVALTDHRVLGFRRALACVAGAEPPVVSHFGCVHSARSLATCAGISSATKPDARVGHGLGSEQNDHVSAAGVGGMLQRSAEIRASAQRKLQILLEDRQCVYKRQLVVEGMDAARESAASLLRDHLGALDDVRSGEVSRSLVDGDGDDPRHAAATAKLPLASLRTRLSTCDSTREGALSARALLKTMRSAFLRSVGDPVGEQRGVILAEFYALLLLSTVVSTTLAMQHVVDMMVEEDGIAFSFGIGASVMLTLISLAAATAANSPVPSGAVNPGELAFYYFGRILNDVQAATVKGACNTCADDTASLWALLFTACVMNEVAPKLFDLWWDLFLESIPRDATSSVPPPIPYAPLHGALTWCATNRDIERALKVFSTAGQRGVLFPPAGHGETEIAESGVPGNLTRLHPDLRAQGYQLRLLVRLLSLVKSVKMDGGIRENVVRDIRRLISPGVLQSAPWPVINDLLSGLSMPSAMRLIRFRVSRRGNAEGENTQEDCVPFALWASLLRRCAREAHISESESLFHFIRASFPLKAEEKRELVEIMLRMYATLPQPDFATALHLYVDHVVDHPDKEPQVAPDTTQLNLLLRAADSRNAAMMIFLESCADGIHSDKETFEYLLSANPYSAVSALNRRLPHGYTSSQLDSQLRIPANVDAHLRREEALRARGKPLYDSTGEVV